MRARRTTAFLLTLGLVLTCASGPAWSYHNDKELITDDTAYTLRDGELRFGLWRTEYGVLEKLTLGTYNLLWFGLVPSLSGKYELYSGTDYVLSAKLGYLRVNFNNFFGDLKLPGQGGSGTSVTLNVIPFEVMNSYRLSDNWRLHGGFQYTPVLLGGEARDSSAGLAVTNLQLVLGATWRWGDVTALQLTSNSLVFQQTSAAVDLTLTTPDNYTTIRAVGVTKSDALNFKDANAIVASVLWSWETFNLRMGASLGAWNVPALHFIVPLPFFPELDMYWRW